MPERIGHSAFDVAIVGGGPAGLAAAVYLGRFLRSVVVFDAGDARARLIPRSRNCPGFPEGIAGEELIRRLREQARSYGAIILEARVELIEEGEGSFMLSHDAGVATASLVVLATGIVDKAPEISGLREAIDAGLIRLCPVCDAFEAADLRIGVIGLGEPALKEALFLRDYSPHVSIFCEYPEDMSEGARMKAVSAGIEVWGTVDDLIAREDGFDVMMADGSPKRRVDVVYPAMGCTVRSELALRLGVDCDEEGYVLVGRHLETSVPGVYAIGDVAKALNQIAVGFGHAALAAAHIHNALRDRDGLDRPGAPA